MKNQGSRGVPLELLPTGGREVFTLMHSEEDLQVTGKRGFLQSQKKFKSDADLFRAVVPASLAGITAVRSYLEIGILALCTDWLIMFYPNGLLFLIHENWLLFYYLDVPWWEGVFIFSFSTTDSSTTRHNTSSL
jgi:hypothetical protein